VLVLHSAPFSVELYNEDVLVLAANSHQLMHFEQKIDNSAHIEAPPAAGQQQQQVKDRHGGKEILSYGEDGLAIYTDGTREEKDEETPEQDLTLSAEDWQSEEKRARRDSWRESFGGHTDSRPHGPMSVGIDFSFPSSAHLYGIPEHATSLALKSTKVDAGQAGHAHYHEPYRMYNLDVFEYELDEPMALYGNIPMMMAHGLHTKADGAKTAVTAVCVYMLFLCTV
jgi:alpha 1,3-glucosidase